VTDPVPALLIAIAAIFAATCIVALRAWFPGRLSRLLILGVVGITAALTLRTTIGASAEMIRGATADYPVRSEDRGYVSSDQCRACHPREYATWHSSYHRTMTQRPSPESVAGLFDVSLSAGDDRLDLTERDGRFLVGMPKPEWWHGPSLDERIERPVELMTGSHHYQVYWVSSGNSRMLAQVPFVFLIRERLWFPRRSVFMVPPDEVLDAEYARWNTNCIMCHTTNGRPRPQLPRTDLAQTEVGEFGIACEACHGPGGRHVQQMSNPLRRYSARLGIATASGIVNPAHLPAERSAQVCGQCHSVHELRRDEFEHWIREGFRFRPGDDLNVTRRVIVGSEARNDAEHFWPDGAVRVTGREYNALLDSPCFKSGKFTCLSCHEPHKQEGDARALGQWRVGLLRPFEEGNEQCQQCHQTKTGDRLVAHTHHASESSGSVCVNCHMPHTVYGLAKMERDHRISSPRVRDELATGRPNACNLCHIERTLDWSGRYLAQWYEQAEPALTADQQQIPASLLWLYRGDAHQRAIAMWAMGWPAARATAGQEWAVPELTRAMDDPYQVLGLVAWRSLRKILGDDALPGSILALPPSQRVQATEAAIGHRDGFDPAAVARLLSQRDNRPVRLSE